MYVKVEWDLGGEELNDLSHQAALAELGLPSIVSIPDDVDEEFISDWLSDEYGFCHRGWSATLYIVK
tara:strand:- start:43 stop:243 length:201 start_codon:yes stop_codon:yes gene_type:complete